MLFQYGFGAPGLRQAFYWLQQYGIADVILPFILIFAILYAILDRTQIFPKKKNINAVIALSISLLTVIPHVLYPSPTSVVNIINRMLPGSVVIAIVLLLLMVLTGFGAKEGRIWRNFGLWAPWLAVIALAFILWAALSPTAWPGGFSFLQNSALITALIVLLVAGIVIAWITGEGEGEGREEAVYVKPEELRVRVR